MYSMDDTIFTNKLWTDFNKYDNLKYCTITLSDDAWSFTP